MHTAETAEAVNVNRRRFLTRSANVVGAVGGIFVAVPFLASWTPSEKARAAGAPVEVDISKLKPGALLIVEWRGKPVWILKRTQEMLDSLPALNDEVLDPQSDNEDQQPAYARNIYRAREDDPGILVMVGICTHLGCSPKYHPEPGDIEPSWQGGFFCPCHGSKFDLAGRVYQNVPAPTNMVIPRYAYLDEAHTRILIGDDGEVS